LEKEKADLLCMLPEENEILGLQEQNSQLQQQLVENGANSET